MSSWFLQAIIRAPFSKGVRFLSTVLPVLLFTIASGQTPPKPAARAPAPDILPGNGLAQHDFLYAGEWDTRKDSQTVFLLRKGQVVWTCSEN
jgi:hypothetical protein